MKTFFYKKIKGEDLKVGDLIFTHLEFINQRDNTRGTLNYPLIIKEIKWKKKAQILIFEKCVHRSVLMPEFHYDVIQAKNQILNHVVSCHKTLKSIQGWVIFFGVTLIISILLTAIVLLI